MEWAIVGETPQQLLSPGRKKPTLVVNQSETGIVLLSTESSISSALALRLHPNMGIQWDTDESLWARSEIGETALVLHNSNGTIFSTT